jgi:drug/metabolite transporter (DMT)-like permease
VRLDVSVLALALVLGAAVIHATWNYLLKRSGGGTLFVWAFATLSALIYAPLALAILWWQKPALGWTSLALMLASAVIHTAYYLLLDRGYRTGDLSLVYPLARGSAPLITVAGAVFLLHEHPTALAVTGAVLIGGGAVLLTGNLKRLKEAGSLPAVGFALLTGCMIASYTVVDKIAVAAYLVPPLLQDWATNAGRVVIMTPMAMRQRQDIRRVWARCRLSILGVAVLCPLSYILVLSAMVFTPVSYVAPAREISILVAAAMGTQLLAEKDGRRRLAAAGAMVIGIVCLALG